jgi:hypothetical protein
MFFSAPFSKYLKTIEFIIQTISRREKEKLKEINSNEQQYIEFYYFDYKDKSAALFIKRKKCEIKGKLNGCQLVKNILGLGLSIEDIIIELATTSKSLSSKSLAISHNSNGEYKVKYDKLKALELNEANSVFYLIL